MNQGQLERLASKKAKKVREKYRRELKIFEKLIDLYIKTINPPSEPLIARIETITNSLELEAYKELATKFLESVSQYNPKMARNEYRRICNAIQKKWNQIRKEAKQNRTLSNETEISAGLIGLKIKKKKKLKTVES